MQANPQIFAIVAGWEAAVGDNTTLFFPVNWDWRRDFFEQSKRVYDMVLFAKSETGCNPIVVGHSLGGLLTYTTFTRYGKKFADNVHGVLYGTAPLTPAAGGVGGKFSIHHICDYPQKDTSTLNMFVGYVYTLEAIDSPVPPVERLNIYLSWLSWENQN